MREGYDGRLLVRLHKTGTCYQSTVYAHDAGTMRVVLTISGPLALVEQALDLARRIPHTRPPDPPPAVEPRTRSGARRRMR